MIERWRRRRLRLRLTIASFVLSALVAAGALAASVAVLHVEVDTTIRGRLHDRVDALVSTIETSHGRVEINGTDDLLQDSPNWVFDASGAQVEGTHRRGAIGSAVRRLGRSTVTTSAQTGTLHLLAVPVRNEGRVVAVAVTGVDETPYLATLDSIIRDGILLGILAVLGATGLAALVLGRSLGPMTTMTERAAEWSRHRSGSRFALGPPRDELTGLAAVLDELLDRVEEALAAERRLTAEIAHELRSPLTLLIGEADLALMNRATPATEIPRYERIHDAATAMARAITELLDDAAAASEGSPDTVAREAVATVVASLDATVAVDVSGPSERVAVRFVQLERMLAPVLDNAISAAASRVTVVVAADGEDVTIRITDDGAGIDPSVAATLFDPGVTTKSTGTGLGLALARRLVLEAGGAMRVASTRPATFELRLPRVLDEDDDEVLVSAGRPSSVR
ncbi:MAG: HAMP domain-containing histidine kinase [Acidobacteria bacterium]|nr:HAMP domain-containing histidine kinase [Acidobacteriota bacterium]